MVAMGFSTTLVQGRDGSLYRTASEQACDISPAKCPCRNKLFKTVVVGRCDLRGATGIDKMSNL
jgi:hypothetical protein